MNFSTVVIAALTSLVTGVATWLITNWASRFLFGPKLAISFSDEFCLIKTREIVRPAIVAKLPNAGSGEPIEQILSQEHSNEVQYVRLMIKNSGVGAAMKCRGFLSNVERAIDANHFKRLFVDCLPLCWSYVSNSEPQTLDLLPGVNATLDIVSAHHSKNATDCLLPRLTSLPHFYKELFSQEGVYLLTVVVVAENAKPREFRLRLDWNNAWSDIKVRQI